MIWLCVLCVVVGLLVGGGVVLWLLRKALEDTVGGFFGW